jgi:polypeptide N-acetylgalactosaminyltransferase
MDEYAQYLYARDPERYSELDVGDMSYMKNLKQKLQCKPFKYFIEEVAPDMLERYPYIDPPAFASGAVRHPCLTLSIISQ